MADVFVVSISAAPELALEREVLGRAVTEVPTTLAWRIVQTPHPGEEPDAQAIAEADAHLLILGNDIRAPIGVEWLVARRAGRLPTLFLKNLPMRTQAATAFVRELERFAEWRSFDDAIALRRMALDLLTSHILDNQAHFDLDPAEADRLRAWRQEQLAPHQPKLDQTRGGAGESGIILSTERYVPSEGVLIKGEPQKKRGKRSEK
jgi:hypothetical protein